MTTTKGKRSHIWFSWALALCLSGCTYWSSNRPDVGTYAGNATFGEQSETLSVDVVLLGNMQCPQEKAAVLTQQSAKARQTASPNKALLCADIGIAALGSGDLEVAGQMLDEAVPVMTSVTVAGDREREATSLSGSESGKYFKGEPHERAMTLFFRGLLYLVEGDVDNAQACFREGTLQDATAEQPDYRGDWLAHDLMLLECKKNMDSTDADDWREFLQERYPSDLLPVQFLDSTPVDALLVVCVGFSPQKLALERKEQLLQYKRRESRIQEVRVVRSDGQCLNFTPTDDVYVQAVTRGSRNMDAILERQAGARTSVEVAGSAAAAVGAAANVIPGAALVGGLLKELSWSISDSIDSSADCRQLVSIPDKVFLVPLRREWAISSLSVQLLGSSSQIIGSGELSFPSLSKGGFPQLGMMTFRY